MKKMRIIFLVAVAIIVLAGFLAAEAMGDQEKTSFQEGVDAFLEAGQSSARNLPDITSSWITNRERNAKIAIIGASIGVGVVVSVIGYYLFKIAEQQKKILENKERDIGDHLKEGKQLIRGQSKHV